MKTYNDSVLLQEQSILLMGPPGGGKTTFALQWPGLWVADCDQNLAGPCRFLKAKGKTLDFKYDNMNFDDSDKPIDAAAQWDRLLKKTQDAWSDPTIKTIFIDSLTHLDRMLYAYCCREQKVKELTFNEWRMFKEQMYSFIMTTRSKGKTLLMSCHENVEYDKKGQIEKYTVTLSGQLKNYLGYMFTDCWRCSLRPIGAGQVKAVVQVHPTAMSDLKNSLLFGKGEIDADYNVVKTAIEGIPK